MNSSASFLMTHLLFIVTLIAGATLTSLQANFTHVAHAAKVTYQAGPAPLTAPASSKQIEEISDSILFAWAAGGSLCGAYCGIMVGLTPITVAQNEKRSFKTATAFTVSLLTGLLGTPYLVQNYFSPCRWSTVFLLGGVIASGAWLIWAAYQAILNRFVMRAQKDGIAGVIDEAKGKP